MSESIKLRNSIVEKFKQIELDTFDENAIEKTHSRKDGPSKKVTYKNVVIVK
jgi:hypothetical protein